MSTEPERANRRLIDMGRMILLAAAAILLAACGSTDEPDTTQVEPQDGESSLSETSEVGKPVEPRSPGIAAAKERSGGDDELAKPPPITVRAGSTDLEVDAWAFCWEYGCVDGAAPENPPDAGSSDELIVEFPEPDWEFTASLRKAGEPCGQSWEVPLEAISDTTHRLTPQGFAGAYEIGLTGRGDNGDVIATILWTTTTDGPRPEPTAVISMITEFDGEIEGYAPELAISNLAETPKATQASLTVEAADGESMTIDLEGGTVEGENCPARDGELWFGGSEADGQNAAKLGESPFTYTVSLMLDGDEHVAHATWPDDQIPDWEPSISLTFDPPLPSLE